MKSTYYLFLCLCIPLFALTSCENDLEGDNFGQDTERYDIPLTSKSAEVNAKVQNSLSIFIERWLVGKRLTFVYLL